jgi:hypothetical protein
VLYARIPAYVVSTLYHDDVNGVARIPASMKPSWNRPLGLARSALRMCDPIAKIDARYKNSDSVHVQRDPRDTCAGSRVFRVARATEILVDICFCDRRNGMKICCR